MKYQFVDWQDPILHEPLPDFDFNNPPVDPVELVKDLRSIMTENKGAGLSANQLGLPYRVCVINSTPALNMFNPVITYYNTEKHTVETEGCLSRMDMWIKIRRPDEIRVRYTDENGVVQTTTVNGIISRIVQHEVDHLNGIDYSDRASEYHLNQAKANRVKMKRKLKKLGIKL